MSRPRFTASDALICALGAPDLRECWTTSPASRRWTEETSLFQALPAKPRRSVQFRSLWTVVDKWITCWLFPCGKKGIEDQAGENGSTRDESGEVCARRR